MRNSLIVPRGRRSASSSRSAAPIGTRRRDLGHHADVEALGLELAAGDGAALALAPGDAQVALRPGQAVAGAKAEATHGDRGAIAEPLGIDPAGDLLERERLDARVQAQRDRAQGDVERDAGRLAAAHLEPGAQRAVAFAQLERQRNAPTQLAQVGARQLSVGVAAPEAPVAALGEQRLGEAAAQAEALAPARGRRRIEPQVVLAQAVANHELDVAQDQRRRLARVVEPAHGAGADHELVLLEEPLGGAAVVLAPGRAGEVETGDPDPAALVAPHVQARPVDQELREARLQRQQRARRKRREDARQGQRDALLGVEDLDLTQLDRRHPATRFRRDRAYSHRRPDQGAGARLDGRTPLLDVRQNQPMK